MGEFNVDDRLALDRDVARAVAALARWRREVAADPDVERVDPFGGLRHVAGKSTWEALGALAVSPADEPLRTGLRRWVAALLQARLEAPDDIAVAREETAPRSNLDVEEGGETSWRGAWRGVVQSRTTAGARRWLAAAAEMATPIADVRRARTERRDEVARRLGFSHPWDAAVPPGVSGQLAKSARRYLDATDDVWRVVRRESLRGVDRPDAADVLHAAVARAAGDGWPARLTARWLSDLFGGLAGGMRIDVPPLPAPLGASSFARALQSFGYAVRVAAAPRAAPFAVRSDPAFVGAHRFAFLFGSLAANVDFHRRALGLGEASAGAQCRVLARTALVAARLDAARIVLGSSDVQPPRDVFDEMGERLFGSPLEARMRGAWPAVRDDEPARWVARLQTADEARAMRESFDTDWFRNPKAWRHLVGQAAAPAYETLPDGCLDTGPDALAHAFEEALG